MTQCVSTLKYKDENEKPMDISEVTEIVNTNQSRENNEKHTCYSTKPLGWCAVCPQGTANCSDVDIEGVQ